MILLVTMSDFTRDNDCYPLTGALRLTMILREKRGVCLYIYYMYLLMGGYGILFTQQNSSSLCNDYNDCRDYSCEKKYLKFLA